MFRPASADELGRLVRPLIAARLFTDEAEVRAAHAADPWRVLVAGRDVAVCDRWRDHLGLLAVEALWCTESRVAGHVLGLIDLAHERGYDALLSPPVPEADTAPYEAAGMHVIETASSWWRPLARRPVPVAAGPPGMTVRVGGLADIPAVAAADGACFEPFWRYDLRHLERLVGTQRLTVAESGDDIVGYTLSTVDRGHAQLGRLGVVPTWRHKGVGRALLDDAMRAARARGAVRLTLCTQVDNAAARALYGSAGFEESDVRFAFLRSD